MSYNGEEVIINTPDTMDTDSCVIQQTTDEQLNYNMSELVKLLITALQDGTVPVGNTDRLQNLTITDIIELARKEIGEIDFGSHIVTGDNGEVTNIIDMITAHSIVRDSKFVDSEFIRFKIETEVRNGQTKQILTAHLPKDLINSEKIVAIYITTRNDANPTMIENEVIFEHKIFIDTYDELSRYKIEIDATKIDPGTLVTYDVGNLPETPKEWGTWTTEKYLKVTYLVDTNWVSSPIITSNNIPNQFEVAKSTKSGPIKMSYGNSQIDESVNIYNTESFLIEGIASDTIAPLKTSNTLHLPDWVILSKDTLPTTPNDFSNFINDSSKIIKLASSTVIDNLIDNIKQFNPLAKKDKASELNNIFVMPANKVISLKDTKVSKYEKNQSIDTAGSRIIENLVTDIIDAKVSTILAGNHAGANNSSVILVRMYQDTQNSNIYMKKIYIPDYIIMEIIHEISELETTYTAFHKNGTKVINFKSLLAFTYKIGRLIKDPAYIIELKKYLEINSGYLNYKFSKEPDPVIEQKALKVTKIENSKKDNSIKYITLGTIIIEQLDILLSELIRSNKYVTLSERVIEQDPIHKTKPRNLREELFATFRDINNREKTVLMYDNTIINAQTYIINPLAVSPALMTISSGSVTYLQDLRNLKMISSLANKTEYIPLYTGEGQQQRSVYELVAEKDQRVFEVATNIYDTTVYREGFRLSRGDYYVNGRKVILKAAANMGETITIVSERKYTYTNTVTREELENTVASLKATTPIISYPATTYELATVTIVIENYNSLSTYDVSIKYDGTYRNDIAFIRNNDTIYLDIPEVIHARRQVLQLTIRAYEPGKIQSIPITADIQIRNLYDAVQGSDVNRLVMGTTPDEWFGKSLKKLTFADDLTEGSNYTLIPADSLGPKRISIAKDDYIQSKLIASPQFTGDYLDTFIGLENLNSRRIPITSSTPSETILDMTSFTQKELEDAFKNDQLWFIIDASTENSLNREYLNAVNGANFGTNQKYAYRNAKELMKNINLLPRTADSLYMEHIDKIKNRYIKDIIIFDAEIIVDYDFEDFAELSENGQVTKKELGMESIEYFVQEEVPHLLIKINNPEIPNPNNPYINISSNLHIKTDNPYLNDKQLLLEDSGFQVNNIYNERIFSGLIVDHAAPKQDLVLPKFKDTKTFELGNQYNTNFKKDTFIITEESFGVTDPSGLSTQKEIYLGLVRFKTDEEVLKENTVPQTRIKLFDKILTKEKSIKALVNTNNFSLGTGSTYVSDFSLVEYGGYSTYVDDLGANVKVIDPEITVTKVFIQDNFEIENGPIPTQTQITDGYHMTYDKKFTIRIPNYWDIVLRPSLRPIKEIETKTIWTLIRDAIPLTDQRWLNITDGILERGVVVKDNLNLTGSNLLRDSEVVNMENGNGFLIFGGVGYKPTLKQTNATRVTGSYLTGLIKANHPTAVKLKEAYDKRYQNRYTTGIGGKQIDTGGWRRRKDILAIYYGWENNEPYVEYHWAYSFQTGNHVYGYSEVMNFYVDRVSRVKQINTDIFYINTDFINNSYTLDNTQLSHHNTIIKKFTIPSYIDLYRDTNGNVVSETSTKRPVFQDIVYEAGCWWLVVKPADTDETKLIKFYGTSMPSTASSMQVSIETTLENDLTQWSLIKDITSGLRGDGPILIKHESNTNYNNTTNTNDAGVYYWDTWMGTLENKVKVIIPASSTVYGINEIPNIRNPYFLVLDDLTDLNVRIDIIGTRLYIVVYLDKFISTLNKEEFNLFKEEILHINEGISVANPNKLLSILPNEVKIKIKTILPDADDFRSDNAQVLFNRIQTQTGRKASNLVFRLKNTIDIPLEIDSVRFTSK